MDLIISGHNHNISKLKQNLFECNRRKEEICLLSAECLILKVIYCADVSNEANGDKCFILV